MYWDCWRHKQQINTLSKKLYNGIKTKQLVNNQTPTNQIEQHIGRPGHTGVLTYSAQVDYIILCAHTHNTDQKFAIVHSYTSLAQ